MQAQKLKCLKFNTPYLVSVYAKVKAFINGENLGGWLSISQSVSQQKIQLKFFKILQQFFGMGQEWSKDIFLAWLQCWSWHSICKFKLCRFSATKRSMSVCIVHTGLGCFQVLKLLMPVICSAVSANRSAVFSNSAIYFLNAVLYRNKNTLSV